MVRGWGLPQRVKPEGAVKILYGSERLTFRKMQRRGTLDDPCMKFMHVPILDPKDPKCTSLKLAKKTKKKLLSLEADEYFAASSNPKIELPVRAVLQAVKPKIHPVSCLLDESLIAIRRGDKPHGLKALHRVRQWCREKKKWSIFDHLVYRYARWAIGEAKCAVRTLHNLGITCEDLRHPLTASQYENGVKRKDRWPDRRLFVSDKEYFTGTLGATDHGVPALTLISSE